MPDRSIQGRHRAGQTVSSRRQSRAKLPTSRAARVIAGLAFPTAATVALIFCAAGAAVATSTTAQTSAWTQSAASMISVQPATAGPAILSARHAKEIAAAQALDLKAAEEPLAFTRATEVARGTERRKLAVQADTAKSKKLAAQASTAKRKMLAATADTAKRAAFAHSWRLPISNPVTTSGFGYRWGALHAGEDFAVSVGTPLASMSTGTIVFAGQMSGYGNMVDVRYWDGTVSRFGHMSSVSVSVGQAVAPGQIVGLSGNTGDSTGPHLHLEIHPGSGVAVDPLPWLAGHHIHV